jgi:hypothetical protein
MRNPSPAPILLLLFAGLSSCPCSNKLSTRRAPLRALQANPISRFNPGLSINPGSSMSILQGLSWPQQWDRVNSESWPLCVYGCYNNYHQPTEHMWARIKLWAGWFLLEDPRDTVHHHHHLAPFSPSTLVTSSVPFSYPLTPTLTYFPCQSSRMPFFTWGLR